MDRVAIADCGFLPYGKTASLGQDNKDRAPTNFEWSFAPVESARFVTDGFIPTCDSGKGKIAWLVEPFLMHPQYYFFAKERTFDTVLTHNKYLAENYGWLWYPFGGSYVDFDLWEIHQKNRNISIILSNKRSMPGHNLRHEIVDNYRDQIDSVLGLDIPVRKFDGLAGFRYSIVVENERGASWFTEKLIDCFSVGTIPIYWGSPDIGLYFDTRGIIQIEKLSDIPDAIACATPLFYESRLAVLRENLEIAKQYRIAEDWIYAHYPFLFGKG